MTLQPYGQRPVARSGTDCNSTLTLIDRKRGIDIAEVDETTRRIGNIIEAMASPDRPDAVGVGNQAPGLLNRARTMNSGR